MNMINKIFQMLILSFVTFNIIVAFIDSYQHLSVYKKYERKVEIVSTKVIGNITELTSIKNITFKYNKEIYNLNVNLQDFYKAKHNKFIVLAFSDYNISDNKLDINIRHIFLNILQLIILILLIISINNEYKFSNNF